MKVSRARHSTDIVCEQTGCIDHHSGLQNPFARLHTPAAGNGLHRTHGVLKQEIDAIQGRVLRKSQCKFIGLDRPSGCCEESAIRFGAQVRLQLDELTVLDDAQSRYAIRQTSGEQFFKMYPLRGRERHDERAVTFHTHPKVCLLYTSDAADDL